MKTHQIVLLPGDGVGPEVTAAARHVLEVVADSFGHEFRFTRAAIGGAAIDAGGDPLPAETLKACLEADAVFLGAVGGPQWDGGARRPEEGLLGLRKALGLFANLRPVTVTAATEDRSPLKAEMVRGVDLLIVRELTGGAYFGDRTRTAESASDLCVYTVEEIERVARVAFRAAQGRRNHVTSVDKANVLETSRLWRETVSRLRQAEFPEVGLDHMLVDTAAMRLIQNPRGFDVLLTENMFGDILSDEASVLAGSIGLLGSASLGHGSPGLFEPIHGSAPDIAGDNACNPSGAIRSAAMLLRSLGLEDEANVVDKAVHAVLDSGDVTADLGGRQSCSGFARLAADAVRRARWASTHSRQMHWA
jgi:3-isopropylmalate dehydrogenase